MLSKTLSDGLDKYEIGAKVRQLRLKKKMGLVELGRHTGLSPAMLSKIERGRLFPTLPTLLRISLVFCVALSHFFADDGDAPVVALVRRKDRIRFPDNPSGKKVQYWFESLDFPATERKLSAYRAEFVGSEPARRLTHQHAGAELIYVMAGKLLLTIHSRAYVLGNGDSIYFDSSAPHSYGKSGRGACCALVVTAS